MVVPERTERNLLRAPERLGPIVTVGSVVVGGTNEGWGGYPSQPALYTNYAWILRNGVF